MKTALIIATDGARDRNRTGTPVIHEAADFKSDVSTYFTTRAKVAVVESAVVSKATGSTRHCETKSPINTLLTGPISRKCGRTLLQDSIESRS